MKKNLPTWAMKMAAAADYDRVKDEYHRGRMQITLPDHKTLRQWAKQKLWPTPWFGFTDAFITKMVESQETFALALNEAGITILLTQESYILPAEKQSELDTLYGERSNSGWPTSWGILVEELRDIRRAVEAGVVVEVEGGKKLHSFQDFYTWAHGCYHALEDGYDSWIGDDQ
ncbi:MAG: hypothetical protein KJ063_04420 [Anaerolineae bacterium]|nr:hypothetical protein [Anaerolineae bacterium]